MAGEMMQLSCVGFVAFLVWCIGYMFFYAAMPQGAWGEADSDRNMWCERVNRKGSVREPMNSFSNVSYFVVGAVILSHRQCCMQPKPTTSSDSSSNLPWTEISSGLPVPLTGALGLSHMFLGIGSFGMHATNTDWGHTLDIAGMYAAMNATLLASLWRWCYPSPIRTRPCVLYWVLLLLLIVDTIMVLLKYMFVDVDVVMLVFPVQVALAGGSELFRGCCRIPSACVFRRHFAVWCTAFVLTGSAYALWMLGVNRVVCDPDSWLQPHAWWHILTGVALGFAALGTMLCESPAAEPKAMDTHIGVDALQFGAPMISETKTDAFHTEPFGPDCIEAIARPNEFTCV